MKRLLYLLVLIPALSFAQNQRTLSGKITDGVQVLQDVKVTNVTTDMVTATDLSGFYEIEVKTGDKVQFSSIGMKTKTIKVEDVTRILNLEMVPEVTKLDEVVVSKKLNKSQEQLEKEFPYNPEIVKTGFKYINAKRFPGQSRTINMDELETNAQCILDLLAQELGDVRRTGTCDAGGNLHIGNPFSTSPITIYEIDGQVYDEVPIWLNIKTIKRVAIVAGEYWRSYYGDDALNGVVFINTTGLGPLRGVDKARLRDNYIKTPDLAKQYATVNKLRKQNEKIISGTVTDGKSPIPNVNVTVANTNTATTTNEKGKYKIKAVQGDVIEFSYIGLKTVKIKVQDVTRILNPILIPEVTQLEEVVVEGSARKSQGDLAQDYNNNKTIIKTAYGYLDSQTSPGQIRMLSGDEINTANACILDMLRSRFPGITVTGDCQAGGAVNIRGGNSISNRSVAIFDVDGQIFQDAPIWLDINNIKRLAIFSNFALTTQYGAIANGGVIVINTINGTLTNNGLTDQGLLRNNFISGRILTKADIDKNKPTYLKELEAASSFKIAKEVFKKYESAYISSPYFYLDAYTYFTKKWDQADYADEIIEENYGLFQQNAVLLKALAYQYEVQERFELANQAYKEAFLLRPSYAQSYMDMANSYRDINEPKQAASLYARYQYLLEKGFIQEDTIGFGPIIEREFNNLLALNKNMVVDQEKANQLYIAEEDFKGTRLVFEWNDSEAEFDLQFVNPGSQYYVWSHSLEENSETIEREKDYGYNVTEYLLDGSLPGTWSVNVNYLGNKSLTPTYMKATIYYNYGSPSQRKQSKVFKLSLKNVNQELFKVQSIGVVTN